jgi:N-acetylglucosaminyldiphosphoundecaprenol N-acetyl-beta-D-mannosaminyltransferase
MSIPTPPRESILGVGISAINLTQAVELINRWVTVRELNYVCVTPAHGVMECQKHPELRRIFNRSGLTTPDGMSIVWLLKILGHKQVSRVYGPDLLLAVCERSLREGYRHFFYGSTEAVVEGLETSLCERFPGLEIAGTFSPPFTPLSQEDGEHIVELINSCKPDIIWVGLSTPKQERWMAEFIGKVTAPVLIGVGAAFDFLSGSKPQAPRWIQRIGFEWLFRLISEPKRLWKRYLEYPLFVLLVIAQLTGVKKFHLE